MPTKLAALFIASLGLSALVYADNDAAKESFDQTTPFNATGELIVDNVNGSIEIRTWDKNEIRIAGEKSAGTEEDLRLIELTIEASPSRVAIKARLPRRSRGWFSWFRGNTQGRVQFTLTVPATAVLRKITTVNSSITIEGVRGEVNASTVNGRIKATGLAADATLHIVNGTIDGRFATVLAKQQLSFKAVNGSITIRLPKDANVDVAASRVNGRIACDLPIKLSGDSGKRSLKGTIGDGGASLHAEIVNGSIRIREL